VSQQSTCPQDEIARVWVIHLTETSIQHLGTGADNKKG